MPQGRLDSKMENEYNGTPVVRYEVQTFDQRSPAGLWIQLSCTPLCHSQDEAEHYMALVKLGRFRFRENKDAKPEFHPADGLYRIVKVSTQYEITYTTEAAE
jgi:hypothetical protein